MQSLGYTRHIDNREENDSLLLNQAALVSIYLIIHHLINEHNHRRIDKLQPDLLSSHRSIKRSLRMVFFEMRHHFHDLS
jgi:hypothetical protein